MALFFGAFISFPVMMITKDREPWLTFLLAMGLSLVVVVPGLLIGLSFHTLGCLWLASMAILLLVRFTFGLKDNIEHFAMAYIVTVLMMMFSVTLRAAQQKAARLSQQQEQQHER